MVGGDDELCSAANAKRIQAETPAVKTYYEVPGANHNFFAFTNTLEFMEVLVNQIELDIADVVEEKPENVTKAVKDQSETLGASFLGMGVVTVLAAALF